MFDKRVVQRNIRTGRVTKGDYGSFLTALPDLAQQVRSPDDGGDDDGFDVREARAQAARAYVPPPRPTSPYAEAPRPSSPVAAPPVAASSVAAPSVAAPPVAT